MTHVSRDTTTGLNFEERTHTQHTGINVSKNELYKYLKKHQIKWEDYISRKLLPDEAYIENNTLHIYEKKFQQVPALLMRSFKLVDLKFNSFVKLLQHQGLDKHIILIF